MMPSLIAAPLPYFFFFNDTATTEIYTLSLHDALPISRGQRRAHRGRAAGVADAGASRPAAGGAARRHRDRDRKSTRLNSGHGYISYAVFCLKKKQNAESGLVCRLLFANNMQLESRILR